MATTCTDCGSILAPSMPRCDHCGSGNRSVQLDDYAVGHDLLSNVKQRHGSPGKVKPFKVTTNRRVWNRDRQQFEIMTLVTEPDADFYEQTWRDKDGNVTWSKRGSLRDPNMHGPASHVLERDDSTNDGSHD